MQCLAFQPLVSQEAPPKEGEMGAGGTIPSTLLHPHLPDSPLPSHCPQMAERKGSGVSSSSFKGTNSTLGRVGSHPGDLI